MSCHKAESSYNVPLQTSIEIPPGLNTIETHIFIKKNVFSLYQENLHRYNLSADNITKVTAIKAKLYDKFSSANLDFISRVSVYIVDSNDPSLFFEMYYLDFVNLTEDSSIELLPTVRNIKDIISKGTFDLQIRLNFRFPPPTNKLLDLDFEYLLYQ
jgi:hypothetical protein